MKKIVLLVAFFLSAISTFAQSQSSNSVVLKVIALPPCSISAIAPTQAYAGQAVNMTITGAGYASGSTVSYDGATLTSTIASATSITLTIPAASVTLGNHTIIVNCSVPLLSMTSPVTLPNAKAGTSYSANLATLSGLTGGVPPYKFSLSSGTLPTGLSLSSNGNVLGTPSGAGSFNFGFTVKDSSGLTLKIGEVKEGIFSVQDVQSSSALSAKLAWKK